MTKRGFTLIELLVVIAIIAILAAILFPFFAKARFSARMNNARQNHTPIAQSDVDDIIKGLHGENAQQKYSDLLVGRKASWERDGAPVGENMTMRTIKIILTDGRESNVSVPIPNGAQIASMTLMPITAEMPQQPQPPPYQ